MIMKIIWITSFIVFFLWLPPLKSIVEFHFSEKGEFPLETIDLKEALFQKSNPDNDECGNATEIVSPGQNFLASDVGEVICINGTNLEAGPEYYDPANILNPYNFPDLEECAINVPLNPGSSGVWYRFTTGEFAARIDINLIHSSSKHLSFTLFEDIGGCEGELIVRMCEISLGEGGSIQFENYEIKPETRYFILISGPDSTAGDFELCINLKPPKICDEHAPYYYNHAEVICGLNALSDFCLLMGPPIMNFSWPGCEFCCAFHNPQWFVFVAGESEDEPLSIDVEITECQNNQGVQIALYQLPCDTDFNPSQTGFGIQPISDMLISDCNLVQAPQQGVVNFTVNNVQAGAVYGIVVDGWANDRCRIEVLNVSPETPPEDLSSIILQSPEFISEGVLGEDTICLGIEGVKFFVDDSIKGVCTVKWYLENQETGEITEIQQPTNLIDTIILGFQEAGVFDICVVADNLCSSTLPSCRTINVVLFAGNILEHPTDLSIYESNNARFSVSSIDPAAEYQWQADFGSGFEDLPEGTLFFGVNTSSLLVRDVPIDFDGLVLRCIVTLDGCSSFSEEAILQVNSLFPEGTVHCRGDAGRINEVVNPVTGRSWLDRNLGASRPAFISRDRMAYGDLYQWGRFSDGHQCRNSSDTSELSTENRVEHGHFILKTGTHGDWRTERSDELWDGLDAINNPCPAGYRIPTQSEWREESLSWSSNSIHGAMASPLKLPLSGMRQTNGNLSMEGSWAFYWSSTIMGDRASAIAITANFAFSRNAPRASGYSVRCIKEDSQEIKREDLNDGYVDKLDKNDFVKWEEKESLLRVYPNPTTGILFIDFPEGQKGELYQIQLFNRWGQQMVFHKGKKDFVEINLEHLIPGVYILKVVGDQGTFFQPKSIIIH
ncbi:MAG: T9SS C-terminal target domain-containing protein [Saprospirales bacterium]|nr:MAG: T9SS C-terminal target domain-containing protein [Saprospirales bacterium]